MHKLDPFTLIVFGASGDLTRRKLVPAVYHLFREGLLPGDFAFVGFARREKSDDSFRDEMHRAVQEFSRVKPVDDELWRRFAPKLHYHRSSFDDAGGYRSLHRRMREQSLPENRLFYLATQPRWFVPVVERLLESELICPECGPEPWSRIIIEKPFGHSLDSARELNAQVRRCFAESQIFRIDHYLGKETVQNILVLRFANSIFEPIWNQRCVDHVQITVAESIGIEGRGAYYDQAGALRDMVQNHMMHLLCLVAMESPHSLDAGAVRDEKVKVLRALRPIPRVCPPQGVIRAQYSAGTAKGEAVPGYLEEDNVAPDSATGTFVALRAYIDNWRWSGVPFYLRTGKRLPARLTEISIHFKPVPQVLFNAKPFGPMQPNILRLAIQPKEGISMQVQVKRPGQGMRIEPLRMEFSYAASFGQGPPEAYERLLLDAARGDSTLFTRSDEVEAAWAFVSPILECLEYDRRHSLPGYPAGTWGPREADDLIEQDGRAWYYGAAAAEE